MQRYQNFIFDLDGTLFKTHPLILKSLSLAYEELGIDIDKEKLNTSIIGPPVPDMIGKLSPELSEEGIDTLATSFRRIQYDLPYSMSPPYDGIFTLLNKLSIENKKLFIATNRSNPSTERILEAYGATEMFKDVYTPNRHGIPNQLKKHDMLMEMIKKYGLKKEETLMVGDTLGDIEAARIAGIKVLAVTWGYETDKIALCNGSDYQAHKATDLLSPWTNLSACPYKKIQADKGR